MVGIGGRRFFSPPVFFAIRWLLAALLGIGFLQETPNKWGGFFLGGVFVFVFFPLLLLWFVVFFVFLVFVGSGRVPRCLFSPFLPWPFPPTFSQAFVLLRSFSYRQVSVIVNIFP